MHIDLIYRPSTTEPVIHLFALYISFFGGVGDGDGEQNSELISWSPTNKHVTGREGVDRPSTGRSL